MKLSGNVFQEENTGVNITQLLLHSHNRHSSYQKEVKDGEKLQMERKKKGDCSNTFPFTAVLEIYFCVDVSRE